MRMMKIRLHLVIPSAIYSSKPEDSTALPNTFPPPTNTSVCQDNELKST